MIVKVEKLTTNFFLSEFTQSNEAARKRLPNVPDEVALGNLRKRLAPVMQRVRDVLGHPVIISSGFRSPLVNAAVNGSKNSAHMLGLAADFICPGFGTPLDVAQKLVEHRDILRYDQLIHEGTWVHLGLTVGTPRGEVLTAHFRPNAPAVYTPGLI